MSKLRQLSILSLTALMIGCAGDAAIQIHGVAPKTQYCNISLVDEDNKKVISSQSVIGEFTNTFVWGVWAHGSNLSIVAECDGVVTRTLNNWRMPRNFSEPLELGDISP